MLIEVCANSLQSALNAEEAGADRIELCSELGVGGITPSPGLIQLTRERLNLPIHVLIRPRSGHFTYSEAEFEVMLSDIDFCKKIGVDGIVSGVLRSDFSLDGERTKELVEQAKPLHFTFHRAFDWIGNPQEALMELEKIGVHTVLTSGQKPTAAEGLSNISKWQKITKLIIMAGGGVNLNNSTWFLDAGLKALHFSATVVGHAIDMAGKIAMNSEKHLNESNVTVTNLELVRQIVHSVK